jgi:hypothetical protein|tara:strand:+ start:8283 stop:9251 length:969 start_codon:yes stop_codon:yes gene_type:complete
MKYIFYILISILLFSCSGKKEYQDNIFHKFLTIKTPEATPNPAGSYTVDYIFEYDVNSVSLKAERFFLVDTVLLTFKSELDVGIFNVELPKKHFRTDSITFFLKVNSGAIQTDYSVVLIDIVSKYRKDNTFEFEEVPGGKNILLEDRTLRGEDNWDIDYTEDMYNPYFQYNIPFSKTKRYIIIASLLLLLCIIIYILTRPGKWWGPPIFKGEDWLILKEPTRSKKQLVSTKKGEDDISLSLGLPAEMLKCLPIKGVDSYNQKHIFVTLIFPSNLLITLSNNSAKMSDSRIYSGEKLFHLDEICILYNENKIRFQYTNPNIRR